MMQFYAVTDDKFNKEDFEKNVKKEHQLSYKRNRGWAYFLFW